MADIRCCDCQALLGADGGTLAKGDLIICPECGVEIEVAAVRPLKLRLVPDDDN